MDALRILLLESCPELESRVEAALKHEGLVCRWNRVGAISRLDVASWDEGFARLEVAEPPESPQSPAREGDDLARRLSALAELQSLVLEEPDPAAMMGAVAARLGELLGMEWVAIEELQPDGQRVRRIAGVGWQDERPDQGSLLTPGSLTGRALAAGRPVAVSDLGWDRPLLDAAGGLAAPIPGPDRPFGALCAWTRHQRTFTAEDLQVLQALAHLIAQAQARHDTTRELRLAREVAESAQSLQDRLLALLGHELRSPLAPVLLAVTAMQDKPGLGVEDQSCLAMIRRNIEHEARLINDLLDLSRIQHKGLTYDWIRADAQQTVVQTLGLCTLALRTAGLRLRLSLQADAREVRTDPARLRQVLENLLDNARKFTPPGGTVTIRTSNRPDPSGGPPWFRVDVEDTGIGIRPELLSRIFAPFEQGINVYTRPFGGLGLGLTISRAVAEAHGGSLSVSSAGPGLGATFTLEIPTVARSTSSAPASVPTSTSGQTMEGRGGPLRVLIVEDDLETQRFLALLLQERGEVVSTASCVSEALRLAEAEPFDVVACDLGLPDGSGLDLMKAIRARHPLPGVAVSGLGMDAESIRAAGFAAALTKPIVFEDLHATLRRLARRPRERADHRSPGRHESLLTLVGSVGVESHGEGGASLFSVHGLNGSSHQDAP
jgi:signal transduction histidine kinase/ActR/RegA family two-component response regulator